jgi:hypothetical protein
MKLVYFFLLFLLVPFVAAQETAVLNDNYTLWADITTGSEFYSNDYTTLIIYDPQLQEQYNTNMTQFSTGVYYYSFIPNVTGDWYAQVYFYNSSNDVVALATSTITVLNDKVEVNSMSQIAITLGLMGLIAFFLYLGNDLLTKPASKTQAEMQKMFRIQDFGAFMFCIATLLIIPMMAYLQAINTTEAFAGVLSALNVLVILIIPPGVVLYMIAYILFRIKEYSNWKAIAGKRFPLRRR